MSYYQQWKKHNSSINTLKNNAIYCIAEQNLLKNHKRLDSINKQATMNKYRLTSTPGHQLKTLLDIGLKSSIVCFHTELTPLFISFLLKKKGAERTRYDKLVSISYKPRHIPLNSTQLCKNVKDFELQSNAIYKKTAKSSELLHLRKLPINPKVSIIKIVNLEIFGEHYCCVPKIWSLKVGKQQAWVAIWKRFVLQNIVRGFILNSIKGGYAVAIGKFVAFLPKSLIKKNYEHGKYRFFKILNMRSEKKNIVVKEVEKKKNTVVKEVPWFIPKKKKKIVPKLVG